MEKKTLVLGASPNPDRYAYKAVEFLRQRNFPVVAVGLRNGKISDVEIQKGKPQVEDIHTVTMYVGPANQTGYYDYIIGLNPKRIIFNPGTHNPHLINIAIEKNIEVVQDCTLMMLGNRTF